MLKLKTVTLKNFGSVGNVTQAINLSGNDLTLLYGINMDVGRDSGNVRNGAGKTTLAHAISYALYGEALEDIKLDNLCNKINGKNMLVTFEFEKDGNIYKIERGRKPNLLRFLVNGEESESKGENKSTQSDIDRALGMTHIMFEQIVTLNTGSVPFVRLPAAKQREVIEELLGITALSRKAEAVKELISITKKMIVVEEATIKANIEANQRIETAMARAKMDASSWDAMRDKKLTTLAEEAERLGSIDYDSELGIFDQIDVWTEKERVLKQEIKDTQVELDTLHKEITRLKTEAANIVKNASRDGNTLTRLMGELSRAKEDANKNEDSRIKQYQKDIQRNDNNREALFETKADRLDGIDKDISRLEKNILLLGQEIEELNRKQNVIQEQIDNPDQHSCQTCGQSISGTDHLTEVTNSLKKQLQKFTNEISNKTSQMEEYANKIPKLEEEKASVESKYIADRDALIIANKDLEQLIVSVNEEFTKNKEDAMSKVSDIEQEIINIRKEQEDALKEANLKSSEILQEVDTYSEAYVTVEQTLTTLNTRMVELGSKPKSVFSTRDDVWRAKQTFDNLITEMEAEGAKENPHMDKIKSLEATLIEPKYDALNELISKQKHEDFLLKLLTSKDSFVRKKIIDKNLAFLNNRIQHYLLELSLPHEVKILPDLSIEISKFGRDYDYPQMSRGERNRIILSTGWAFRDVWESLNNSINLLMLDELLDFGMDDHGSEMALSVMKKMAEQGRNVYLISNKESLIGRFDHTLVARLCDEFTTFEEGV